MYSQGPTYRINQMVGQTLMKQSLLLELGMTLFRLEREEALVAYWLMLFQD